MDAMSVDVELAEVRDFLAGHHPFDDIPVPQLERLAHQLRIEYFRRGTRIIARGEDNHHLYVVRSGAVELHDMHGGFMDRGEVGTSFGSFTLVQGNPAQFEAVALEDTLCLVMGAETFHALATAHPTFAHFFDLQRTSRMRGAVASLHLTSSGGAILKTRATDIISRPAVWVTATASIQEAARAMSEHRVSCLLVLDESKLVGIVTDRDLRNRVVAAGIDTDLPVTCIMTADPFVGSSDALAFQVLMEMTSRNIHHLPILDPEGTPEGVITTTDLMRLEQTNPIYLVGDITQAHDISAVAEVSKRLAPVVELLVNQDASAEDIGRIVTAVGDAVERRLLGLAEQHLGGDTALGGVDQLHAGGRLGAHQGFDLGDCIGVQPFELVQHHQVGGGQLVFEQFCQRRVVVQVVVGAALGIDGHRVFGKLAGKHGGRIDHGDHGVHGEGVADLRPLEGLDHGLG